MFALAAGLNLVLDEVHEGLKFFIVEKMGQSNTLLAVIRWAWNLTAHLNALLF
jgi:hypothetical protein